MPAYVSIVIPAYNSALYLAKTIESALGQTYADREIIVVDDGSTDTTPSLLKSFGNRIRVVQQENAGQAAARNHGASISKGDILLFLDSDDLLDTEYLPQQLELLNRFTGADAVYCDHRTIDNADQIIADTGAIGSPRPSGDIIRALLHGPCIITPGLVLMRRAAFEASGGFNQSPLMRGYEDYDLWLRMATRSQFIYNPKTLVSYRCHPAQSSRQTAYQLKANLATLSSLETVLEALLARGNKDLLRFYTARLQERRLDVAWAQGELGDCSGALRTSWRSLLLQPTSPRAWVALMHAVTCWFTRHEIG
jgi:glycosyltransferase involved in cell wall biosynthesis